MAQPFPYTYYACACSEIKSHPATSKRSSQQPNAEEEEHTIDPRDPRSAYSLYPLSHLLYCEDCRQIRCPRCVIEETLNWFCPNCLFEVPSSVVKSDGNRCTRNCYNCPICAANLNVHSLEDPRGGEGESGRGGPFILSCPYCRWSTSEIGIELEKPTGITGQLVRIGNGGTAIPITKEKDKERERLLEKEKKRFQDMINGRDDDATEDDELEAYEAQATKGGSHNDLFANLSAFYKSQLAAQTPTSPFSHDLSFSSPSSFSRIMNLYSTKGQQKRPKPVSMREAASALEGLVPHSASSDVEVIDRTRREGWDSTLSPSQKTTQAITGNPNARFAYDLRPIPTLLCTKRGKRCNTCRHILSKPESKITSTRYKIKLLALNHIPRVSVRYLPPNPSPTSTTTPSISILPPNPAFTTTASTGTDPQTILRPGLPAHILLHITNPLFDPIKVTLATPSITPGRITSRITILCPQFDVGANTDVWDDALAVASATSTPRSGSVTDGLDPFEAGKVWEKGRNWTSVAVEIVPGFLTEIGRGFGAGSPAKKKSNRRSGVGFGLGGGAKRGSGIGMDAQLELVREDDEEGLDEDDDVLEIPIFVRIEYETDVSAEERVGAERERGAKGEGLREKREEAFWTVVGVGRIVDS